MASNHKTEGSNPSVSTSEMIYMNLNKVKRNKWLSFNRWSRERIRQGKKICTSRTKKYVDDPRVDYITPPLPLWFIKTYLFEPEGANSPEELQRVINQIFRKEVDEDREFYVHFGDFSDEVDTEQLDLYTRHRKEED